MAVVIALAVLVSFAPALEAGFVSWDDGLTVTDNFAFRGLDPERLIWMASTSHAGHYQPLSWLSLALDYLRLGLTPPAYPEASGFHATNLALHLLATLLLYALGLRVFGLATGVRSGPASRDVALAVGFATLLHAIHPLRCESVCWVTERRDVLSAPFFLLALLAYLRAIASGPDRELRWGWLVGGAAASAGALALAASSVSLADPARLTLRDAGGPGLLLAAGLACVAVACVARGAAGSAALRRGGWLALSLGCLLLSLLAKAWGIVVPAVLLVLDAWPLRRLSRGSWSARVVEKLPFVALCAGFAAIARWAQVAQQGRLDAWALHGVGDRIVQALYGIAFYPAKTAWPFGLAPLYPIPDEAGLAEPRFAIAAAVTLGVSGGLLWARRSHPWALAAWLAYIAIVSPVLGVQQSGPQLVADRYVYLAGIPLAWVAGGALWWGLQRGPRTRWVALAAALLGLAALGTLTFRQSRIWHDSLRLWSVAYERAPDSPLAALNLGIAIADRALAADDPAERARGLDRALGLVREASARRPSMGLFVINEAILMAARATPPGGETDRALLERAIERGAEAIALAESQGLADGGWYWRHGGMLATAGRLGEAAVQLERALALRPDWPAARLTLAGVLLEDARQRAELEPARALAQVDQVLTLLAALPEPGADVGALRADALGLRALLIGANRDGRSP